MRSFYDAMTRQIDEVLNYLDKRWGEEMSVADQRLQLLVLSLVEISTFVELYRLQEPTHACDQHRFVRI